MSAMTGNGMVLVIALLMIVVAVAMTLGAMSGHRAR
jgi:hypothetical protein